MKNEKDPLIIVKVNLLWDLIEEFRKKLLSIKGYSLTEKEIEEIIMNKIEELDPKFKHQIIEPRRKTIAFYIAYTLTIYFITSYKQTTLNIFKWQWPGIAFFLLCILVGFLIGFVDVSIKSKLMRE